MITSTHNLPLSSTTDERTNRDFPPILERQFILESASKGNFPASLFLVLFTVHMEYSETHRVHNTSNTASHNVNFLVFLF